MTKKKTQPNSSSVRGGYRENAGRKSSWNHRDTCTIRVPKSFAEQLVELARRLDNGEMVDTDTESNFPKVDSLTESIELGVAPLDSPAAQADKAAGVDIDTKSKLRAADFVTQSISAIALDTDQISDQIDKLVGIDTDTESNSSKYDSVSVSIFSSSDSLAQLACEPEEVCHDTETESKTPDFDNVTQSSFFPEHQTLTQSIPDLKEALTLALTIVKAKKSARESIARLLSKLYSTQVSADDLK